MTRIGLSSRPDGKISCSSDIFFFFFAGNEAKQQLQEASGLASEVTFDVDYGTFGALVDKAGYQNRAGEFALDVLNALLSNVKRDFAAETSKAALQSNWTTGVVRLVPETPKKNGPSYHDIAIVNGDIVISIFQLSNISDIGDKLLSKLGDASGLSLKAALDWEKYAEERAEILQQIQECTQLVRGARRRCLFFPLPHLDCFARPPT